MGKSLSSKKKSTYKSISFVDLQGQYAQIKHEIHESIEAVLRSSSFIKGPFVEAFEKEFAAFCGYQKNGSLQKLYCVSCGNGTDAIYLAVKSLGISEGDEVLVPSHTFIGSVEGISQAGARPVFAEICESTFLLDPTKLEEKITQNTKAILAVHLYGQPCNIDALKMIARKYNLFIIEDAAQAHGAYWKNQRTGSLGDIACFSFFPGKNLGAYGDAGAVISEHRDLISRARQIADHGRLEKYEHLFEGVNSRMDGLQAAILLVKLRYLERWTQLRNEVAKYYYQALSSSSILLPKLLPNVYHAWHLFVVRAANRDLIIKKMKDYGICCGIHYPIPLHLQPAYRNYKHKLGDFPITEKISKEIISLPIYPELTKEDVQHISAALTSLLAHS